MPRSSFSTDLTVPQSAAVPTALETTGVKSEIDPTYPNGTKKLRNRDFWHALPDIRSARRRGCMHNWFSGIVAVALTAATFGLFISRCFAF